MKTSIKLYAVAILVALFAHFAKAAEPEAQMPEVKSWWTDFSVSPYGAVKHPDFNGPVYGAGLDIGYSINRSVSLHLANSIFDQGAGWFSGAAIDETELLGRADLNSVLGLGKERFVPYLLGGGSRDWQRDDWGFGVGLGAEVRLGKNLSLGADSRIRAWFHEDKDLLTRGFLSFRF